MVESHSKLLNLAATEFLVEAPACKTVEALDALFLRFAQTLGFDSTMFVNLSNVGTAIAPRVVLGDRAAWIEHYAAQNYARLDPTIPRAFRTRKPFTWEEVERPDAPRRQRQFFGEAREVWARDGLIVPIHGPFGEFSVVNLLCRRRIRLADEETAIIKGVSNIYVSLGLNLAQGALALPPEAAPPLSRRERQCIYWMCMGKRDIDTAEILGISAHTVRGYLNAAKVKFGVETRPELALKALACGLLVPDWGMLL
jgi:DNA-binding CsgD family transcriptional regulator